MPNIVLKLGLDTMVPSAKDKLIAPKISALTAPQLPDLSGERKNLLGAFVLNFDLSMTISNKHRQLLFNIIRRAQDALDEYCRASDSLADYVKGRGRRLAPYFTALRSFEQCLAHLYQAICCMNALSKGVDNQMQFDGNDGSVLERVYLMHSEIKHMDERFVAGSAADETSFMVFARRGADETRDPACVSNVPMWLTNDGLECAKAAISYGELAKELRELSAEAARLATLERKKIQNTSGPEK